MRKGLCKICFETSGRDEESCLVSQDLTGELERQVIPLSSYCPKPVVLI